MLFIVGLAALHPVPAVLLVLAALQMLGETSVPGAGVTSAAWWRAMSWRVAGAVLLLVMGVAIHAAWVRPLWQRWMAEP